MPTKLTKPIFLCGYTSSGKTTIGKELARQLDVPFYDTDELITSQTGQTPQKDLRLSRQRSLPQY